MFKNILVAYDGSNPANNAFEYARFIGKIFGATIEVVSVAPRHLIGDDVESRADIDQNIVQARQARLRLQRRATEDATQIHFHTEVGQPADKIIARANGINADLIVMGCRGVSVIERCLTGSTVRLVMSGSQRPLLVVQ
jgi:nucleotide-binding universal stress UspA family protein